MRALVVGNDQCITAQIRGTVLRTGFECRATDVVALGSAAEHVSRVRRELIVLVLSEDPLQGLEVVREIRSTTDAIVLVVGPAEDPKFILRTLREGADEYLDESDLQSELEATLVGLKTKRLSPTDGGRVISVLAPSGGSGGSTLASNLTTVLAKRHGRAALFDLCLAAGDQPLLFDMKPSHNLADVCRNVERLDQAMFEQCLVRHQSGVHLLAAPNKLEEIAHVNPRGVRQALSLARTLFPYVVIDQDRSFNPEQLAALVQADLVLLVLRLDMTSLRNTGLVLNYLDELGVDEERIRIVVNRYRQPKELPAKRAEKALGVKLYHYVPNDPASINIGTNRGVPVVLSRPRAKVSKSIIAMAESINLQQDHHLQNGRAGKRHLPDNLHASEDNGRAGPARSEAEMRQDETQMKGTAT